MRLGIIADDLTGAADCAVAFGAYRFATEVVLEREGLSQAFEDWPAVVALDTDTRRQRAEVGVSEVSAGARLLRSAGYPIYKKIDSILRGHWAAEVRALRAHTGLIALVAPAFPETGRVTRNGCQYVLATSRQTPCRRGEGRAVGNLGSAIEAQGLHVAKTDIGTVRRGRGVLLDRLKHLMATGIDAAIVDAESRQDLDTIAASVASIENRLFYVGSGGLARGLAKLNARRDGVSAIRLKRACTRVLTVIGTPAEVSQRQGIALAAMPQMNELRMTASQLAAGDCGNPEHSLSALVGTLLAQGDLCVRVSEMPDAASVVRDQRVSIRLAELIRPYIGQPDGVIVTGGDTARAVLQALNIDALIVEGEIEPGVVVSKAKNQRDRIIVTKSGGFGDSHTLIRAYRRLKALPDTR